MLGKRFGAMSIRFKLWPFVGLVIVVASALFGVLHYTRQRAALLQGIDQKLLVAARLAAQVPPEGYYDRIEGEDSVSREEYERIVDRHNTLCKELGLQYLWSCMRADGKIVFTTATSPSKDVTRGDHAGFFETHCDPHAFDDVFRTMETDFSSFQNEWGHGRMVLVPATDTRGRAYCYGASVSMDEVDAALARTLWHSVWISGGVLLVGLGLSAAVSASLARPLRRLTSAAGRIAQGDMSQPIRESGSKEIRSLAASIDGMRDSIRRTIGALEGEVADRTRAEQARRESEQRFRSLFDNVPVGIYRSTPDGRMIDVNRAFAEMFGYPSRQSLLDAPAAATYADPRDRQRWQEIMERQEVVRDFEVQALRHDGSIIWVRDSARLVRNEQGDALYYEGSVEDITERKQAEAALRDAVAQLRELAYIINRSPAVVFLWRVAEDWPVEFVSENVEQFGYTADDLTSGRVAWPSITHPEDAPRLEAETTRHLAHGETEFQRQYRVATRSGEVRWVEDRNRVLRDAQGEPTHIQGIVLDVTQRRQAEEALRDREERLRLMVEQMPAILWTTDRDLCITSAAGAGFAALGQRPEEFIGASLEDILAADGHERPRTPAHHRALAGESVAYDHHYSGLCYESHVEPLRDASGQVVGVIGVGLDVTEQRRLEQEILRIGDAERRRIGQDLHDSVGQQLTGLLFTLAALQRRLAARDLPEAEDAREARDIVTSLGAEVRTLARGLCPVEVEKGGLMGALDALARDAEDRCGITCTFACQPPVPLQDSAAATDLYRIAQEAVNNAVRHGQPQSIQIALTARDGTLVLRVEDDGRGLPPDWQYSDGLGLHGMTYRARRLGGTVHVRPAPQGGTRVTCTIPYPVSLNPKSPREGNRHGEKTQQPSRADQDGGPARR